jgi:predicted glycogen debranching enzyme
MTYLKFDKTELVNLEYSLNKEILRTNRAGSYSCTTIIGCNTRKYHGLLVCPIDGFDGERHVLLSSLDETVIQHNAEFNLGIHKYPGDHFSPKGHKYIKDFIVDNIVRIEYQVGGVVLTKESLLVEKEEQLLVKYTLEDAHSPTYLRFRPFLAFRNIHHLSKANMYANTKFDTIEKGIKLRLYAGYPNLYMQFSKDNEFIPFPDWYYNIEYPEEQERGYEYSEDLFVPGYFDLPIKKGESIYFSASIKETPVKNLAAKFKSEIGTRVPRNSYKNCLINAAQQFIVRKGDKTEIIAGYPWFGTWGRDTFISLPGLTLATGDVATCRAVIDTMVGRMKNGLFPNMGNHSNPAFNSVDAPLWFFWTLQQYDEYAETETEIVKKYGKQMKSILEGFKTGLNFNIKMDDNGLIYAGEPGRALTWMDAVVHGKPVTPRIGYAVEINALWYNAIVFSLELAHRAGDKKFISNWKDWPAKIGKSFVETFWDPEKGYLADCVNGECKDWAVRPNQVIAASLKYSPIDDEMKKALLDVAKKELLTSRGLRTLSPNDPDYIGIYEGDQEKRDLAYHQGTVWPWLLEHFCEAYRKIHRHTGINLLKEIYEGFEDEMMQHGIGTISEIYDGDPPHHPKGTISQAWSVASLLRIQQMIENNK